MRCPLLILSAILLAGCTSPIYRLDAVGPAGEMGRAARFSIGNKREGTLASITVSSTGRRRELVDNREVDTVRFALALDNPSGEGIELPVATFKVHDDMGNEYALLRSSAPPPEGPPVTEVVFNTGSADRLAQTGAVTLKWSYRFREREVHHETRFLMVRYAYRPYYYDPWYPPYPYGYPSVSFGFSYYDH